MSAAPAPSISALSKDMDYGTFLSYDNGTLDGEAGEGALRPETVVINLGRPAAAADGPLNVPITPASALQAGGVAGYARDGHAPWAALKEVIGAL